MFKNLLLSVIAGLLLAAPPLYGLKALGKNSRQEPAQVLTQYLRVLYARDFRQAYRFISSADQQLKKSADYVRERQPFTGFALEAAAKLAGLIEIRTLSSEPHGARLRVKLAMKLPDANGLAPLLLDWNDQRLNALTAAARRKILSAIDSLIDSRKLPTIEGAEDFVLVKEGSKWKIFLDWASGAQVQFAAALPAGGSLVAQPLTKETVARSGETFTIGFKVKNSSANEIVTRIVHRVEPKELTPYLDLVECALLLPVRIQPGEQQIYHSTYAVRGDLPDGTKFINVTYEFKIDKP